MSIWDRLMRYADRDDAPGACWTWAGTKDRQGYGRLNVANVPRLAHQLAYIETFGAVPAGLELDHICGNRACVHPLHLEPVTHAENMRRARRAACGNGHVMSPANTYTKPDGTGRDCLTCMRARARTNSARRRAEGKTA